MGGKREGALWPLSAVEAVVLHHSSRKFSPNMAMQQCLIGTIACPAAAAKGVVHDVSPYRFPSAPALRQSRSPESAKHGLRVKRVV